MSAMDSGESGIKNPASARLIRCTAPIMSFAPEKRGFLLARPLPQLERAGHVDQ
jgi:hypothetical protein